MIIDSPYLYSTLPFDDCDILFQHTRIHKFKFLSVFTTHKIIMATICNLEQRFWYHILREFPECSASVNVFLESYGTKSTHDCDAIIIRSQHSKYAKQFMNMMNRPWLFRTRPMTYSRYGSLQLVRGGNLREDLVEMMDENLWTIVLSHLPFAGMRAFSCASKGFSQIDYNFWLGREMTLLPSVHIHWDDVKYLSKRPLKSLFFGPQRLDFFAIDDANTEEELDIAIDVDYPLLVACAVLRVLRNRRDVSNVYGMDARHFMHRPSSLMDCTTSVLGNAKLSAQRSTAMVAAMSTNHNLCRHHRTGSSEPLQANGRIFHAFLDLFPTPRIAIFAMEALPPEWMRCEIRDVLDGYAI